MRATPVSIFFLLLFGVTFSASAIDCSAADYFALNCNTFLEKNVSLEDGYAAFSEWCKGSQLLVPPIAAYEVHYLSCIQNTTNPLEKPAPDCDPVPLFTKYFTIDSTDSTGIPFDKIYAIYVTQCNELPVTPLSIEQIYGFFKTQDAIKGIRIDTVNGVEMVYGLTPITQPQGDRVSTKSSLEIGNIDINTLLIIVIIGILIILGAALVLFFFVMKKKQNDVIQEMGLIKDKMIALEKTYMKGKLDESTYKKMMQEYQVRLTELEIEISRLKKKKEIEQEKK